MPSGGEPPLGAGFKIALVATRMSQRPGSIISRAVIITPNGAGSSTQTAPHRQVRG